MNHESHGQCDATCLTEKNISQIGVASRGVFRICETTDFYCEVVHG